MPAPADIVAAALGADFDIEQELGGGMARVFVARDNRLGRRVVVKVVSRDALAFDGIVRFQREIEFAIGLQHPHIVPILSAGHVDGTPYLVMPYVDGASVRSLLADGPLRLVDAVRILRGVSQALAFAHARGVVHRDIKPDNILLAGGTPVVADFGIAKAISGSRGTPPLPDRGLTSPGMSLGTPTYMAPEQIAGEDADHRADLYSLGVLGYEMLAGEPPFLGSPQQLFAAHLTEAPVPLWERRPDTPRPLAELVMECLNKLPANRPQDAGMIAEALDRPEMLSGGFITRPVADVPRRRFPRAVLIGLLLALLAAAGMAGKYLLAPDRAANDVTAAALPRMVAVLPLVSIGPDSGRDYVARRLADRLEIVMRVYF